MASPVYAGGCSDADKAVATAVNTYLRQAYINSGAKLGGATNEQVIAAARAIAVSSRTGKDGDITLRDAAYYMHGMYARITSSDAEKFVILKGSKVYDAIKYFAHAVKDKGFPSLEKFMRSGTAPTTPPGGAKWVSKGFSDSGDVNADAKSLPGQSNLKFGVGCFEAPLMEGADLGMNRNFQPNRDYLNKLRAENPELFGVVPRGYVTIGPIIPDNRYRTTTDCSEKYGNEKSASCTGPAVNPAATIDN